MFSRRDTIRALGMLPFIPRLKAQAGALDLQYRVLGRTGRWVVPLALGGQASLQWTREGIDAPDIIVRAVELGVNYLDTANAYGPSQANYGEAFTRLHLKPDAPGYNQALRERLFLASKTGQRTAQRAADDLKRSLTTIFGDGRGYIPDGAYLDSMQIHNLSAMSQVDAIYAPEGALSALLDFRDGTNQTGLNPQRRIWIRHIGITGHQRSDVLMEAIRRDSRDIIDTLLVSLNANDRANAAHQNNVLPLARSRGLGVIAMKVFADGVFYGKEPRFSSRPDDVILTVGCEGCVPPADLVRHPLSLAGVACAVAGAGRIDRESAENDQLVQNLAAALAMDPASVSERLRIESDVASVHGDHTNYFNERREGITQPRLVETAQDGDRVIIRWTTALAGAEPLRSYNIRAGDRLLASLPFRPQLTTAPLEFAARAAEIEGPVSVEASADPPRRSMGD
jgi:aryl-alcohol dehydrogenase-like predicted oxidoreductase